MKRIGINNLKEIKNNKNLLNKLLKYINKLSSGSVLVEIYSLDIKDYNSIFIQSFLTKLSLDYQLEVHIQYPKNNLEKIDRKIGTIWLEIDFEDFNVTNVHENLSLNGIIFNIKVPEISSKNKQLIQDKIIKIKELGYNNEYFIVDTSLYKEIQIPSKNYKLRNRLIKLNKDIIKYCTEENYIVIDCFNKDFVYRPCIDLEYQFFTVEETILFQNKQLPCKECKYYCNTIVYQFEDKLKQKIG